MSAALLTVKEISHRTGISLALVYREIHAGRLRAHCFGKRTYRVSEEDLAAYLAETRLVPEDQQTAGRHETPRRRQSTQFKHLDVSRLLSSQR